VVVRHEIKEKKRAGGKQLLEVPGYLFQALVTNTPHDALAVWRDYNGRAGCECVIKELDGDFALPKLILEKFWATAPGSESSCWPFHPAKGIGGEGFGRKYRVPGPTAMQSATPARPPQSNIPKTAQSKLYCMVTAELA
jgi:hypothetical protein